MGVNVHIHQAHRDATEGNSVVETRGNNVGECIKNLMGTYPGMKDILFDKKGKLRNTIEIYLNQESAYPDELKRRVKDGDSIHLLFMIAGG